MPDQLTPAVTAADHGPPAAAPRAGAVALGLTTLAVLALALGCGALLGVLWEWVWTPPSGAAFDGVWYLDPVGLQAEPGATVWFVLLGLAGGVVYGLVAGRLTDGRELLGLVVVLAGSLLAAWVMFHVGHGLGPPDPHAVARTAEDLTPIPGDLRLAGAGLRPWPLWFESSAFVALPAGAMVGVVGQFLGSAGRGRRPTGLG